MARGIPTVPVDGQQYASIGVAGIPMVLEYDENTGGFHLVTTDAGGVASTVGFGTGSIVGIAGQTRIIQRARVYASGTTTDGEYELVAAVGGQRVKVVGVLLLAADNTEVTFQSGFSGTILAGPLPLPNSGDGFLAPPEGTPGLHYLETETGDPLILQLHSGTYVTGWLQYTQEA